MTNQDFSFCSDFGHATFQHVNHNSQLAGQTADAMKIAEFDRNTFMQGFIHARQGRTDLIGANTMYDAGYEAGKAA